MKMKHNKKRNTAFLYESLIKELTKAVVNQDETTKSNITEVLKKHFNKSTPLYQDLKVYKYLLQCEQMDKHDAERYMYEVKKDFFSLNRKDIFNAQTKLIKEINVKIGSKIFSNFVPNYKTLASIGQFFNSDSLSPSSRILVEKQVVETLTSQKAETKELQHIDKLTYKTFVNKFNNSYSNSLQTEQKDLLTNYITSFSDNGLQLKAFLNEELGRLKKLIEEKTTEAESDDRLRSVLNKLNKFSESPVNEKMVKEVFYIQNLAMEISKNDS